MYYHHATILKDKNTVCLMGDDDDHARVTTHFAGTMIVYEMNTITFHTLCGVVLVLLYSVHNLTVTV